MEQGPPLLTPTDRTAGVRAYEVDFGLRDGPHSDLIKGSSEESGKRTGVDHIATTAAHPNGHAHQILFSNKALGEPILERFLVSQSKGGILSVSINSNNSTAGTTQVDQAVAIGLTRGNLNQSSQQQHQNTYRHTE